jgi:hypothetical protein
MLNLRYLKLIWIACLAISINTIKSSEAKAIGLVPTQDTLESLDIPVSGLSNTNDGVPRLIFNGQYWNIFNSRYAPTSAAASQSTYYVQQDSSGSTSELNGVFDPNLPTGIFAIDGRTVALGSFTQEFSYLSNASAGNYDSVTCAAGSPECVFYTLTNTVSVTEFAPGVQFRQSSLQLEADYQPDSSQNVPEPLTIVGSVLALGLGKQFLRKSNPKRQSAKTV